MFRKPKKAAAALWNCFEIQAVILPNFGSNPYSVLLSEQACTIREIHRSLTLYILMMGTKPDILLLLGMLMLGMALGALLTLIRQKAVTARIIQELEAKFRVQSETLREGHKNDSTKPDAA